jgi:glycosyltransferase involved in cell wall biosynthesis
MPLVSIIVPCFNEQDTIKLLLKAIYDQTYDRKAMEVIIADGMSTDGTKGEINKFQEDHPDLIVKVVDNKKQNIPSGLNRAIETAIGNIIIRLDAHSVPFPDYVERCIKALQDGLGDNVGGIWDIQPASQEWISRSIAIAASHPLGVGDARYRVGGNPQLVDTVPFGAFSRTLIEQIGFYDETLLSNEDYEFNVRIRNAGGKIWLDPKIISTYYARSKFSELMRQYWRYGYWKFRMLIRYPETFRWRQLAGAFVLNWLVLGILAFSFPVARWLLLLEVIIYGSALTLVGIKLVAKYRDYSLLVGVPASIATMHFSWGGGFLWSACSHLLERLVDPIKRISQGS